MIAYIQNLIESNQYVAPAIMAVLSGTISAAILYILKEIPMKVVRFINSQLVTSMVVQTGDWDQDKAYVVVLAQLEKTKINWLRRKWTILAAWNRKTQCVQVHPTGGYGIDFYWFEGRLLMARKFPNPEMHGGDSGKRHEQLVLSWFGRTSHPVQSMVRSVGEYFEATKTDPEYYTEIHKYVREVERVAVTDRITLDDIAIEPATKALLQMIILDFINPSSASKKRKLGIADKLVILMHGEPGTGKTLLCRAIAGELKRALILYPEDASLTGLSTSIHHDRFKTSVLAMEDFDTLGLGDNRQNKKSLDDKETYVEVLTKGTLGTFLNILDGAIPLDGNVIIITTNHLEKIDPAVYRDGRVTLLLPIGRLTASTVKTHLEHLYGPLPELDGYWQPMLGAALHTLKNTALTDKVKLIELIKAQSHSNGIAELNKIAVGGN